MAASLLNKWLLLFGRRHAYSGLTEIMNKNAIRKRNTKGFPLVLESVFRMKSGITRRLSVTKHKCIATQASLTNTSSLPKFRYAKCIGNINILWICFQQCLQQCQPRKEVLWTLFHPKTVTKKALKWSLLQPARLALPSTRNVKFHLHLWSQMCAQVVVAWPTRADTSLALASGTATSYFWRVKICVKGLACLEQSCCLVLFLQIWKIIFSLQGRGII